MDALSQMSASLVCFHHCVYFHTNAPTQSEPEFEPINIGSDSDRSSVVSDQDADERKSALFFHKSHQVIVLQHLQRTRRRHRAVFVLRKFMKCEECQLQKRMKQGALFAH